MKVATKRLGLVLAGTLLALGACELLVRLWGPEYPRFEEDSRIYYANHRGYYEPFGTRDGAPVWSLPYRHHRTGWRLPDDGSEAPQPQGPAREILVVGDSFTYGQGVRYEHRYSERLQQLLDARSDGYWHVRNRGVCGAYLAAVGSQAAAALALNEPELVIYGFVLNDFGEFEVPIPVHDFMDANTGRGPERHWNVWRSRIALLNLVAHALDVHRLSRYSVAGYRGVFADGPMCRAGFEGLQLLRDQARDGSAELVVMIFPLFWKLDRGYPFADIHQKLVAFFERYDIRHLDLLPVFEGQRADRLWAAPTDFHPNEIAHEMAAEALWTYLEEEGLLEPDEPGP